MGHPSLLHSFLGGETTFTTPVMDLFRDLNNECENKFSTLGIAQAIYHRVIFFCLHVHVFDLPYESVITCFSCEG